ncbi:MAG: DUF3868 domain-containing protein [Muribaculaceae bacterium]|nr:DUF3868 domain-containing protein [Muribaculaceae bacterium]
MKRYIIIILALVAFCAASQHVEAKKKKEGVIPAKIDSLKMQRNADYMSIKLFMDLADVKVRSNRAMLYTPRIVSDSDTIVLKSVGVYGRTRYMQQRRYSKNNELTLLTGNDEMGYRKKDRPDTLKYEVVIPYEPWMDGARLELAHKECGCCKKVLDDQTDSLYDYVDQIKPYFPTPVYLRPDAEKVKTRAISGQAFIDFVVDRTEIDPDYRNNQVELAKIRATIDPLATDGDITVKEVFIKGFASPEASYQRNSQLAKGRTESLRQYVNSLYNFGNVISTDYEAEDWAGLRAYVEKSNLKNRDAILKLIDSNRKPDNKEWTIKRTYKEDYKILYNHCYPSLRHSDYRIEYTIRSYSDVEEIKKVMFERPQNLSLQEFFLAAQTMESGSDEFNETFEIAVRMYPEDETANLNAANRAMAKGNLTAAERYLAKAGDSKEDVYSRAAYAFLNRDYDTAEALAKQSIEMGMDAEPKEMLKEIEDIRRRLNVYQQRGELDNAYQE